MRLRVLVGLLGPLGAIAAAAQGNGIRFGFAHFEKTLTNDGFAPFGFTLGFDHDLGSHLAFSIEASFPYRDLVDLNAADGNYADKPVSYDGWSADYASDTHSWSLLYRTNYFPNGNDGGMYVGEYLGVRRITRHVTIVDQFNSSSYSSYYGPFRDTYEAGQLVFPIGMRLGWRGALDGWYFDCYFGLGYQLGGGDNVFTQPELSGLPERTAGFSYTLGFAYGLGW